MPTRKAVTQTEKDFLRCQAS